MSSYRWPAAWKPNRFRMQVLPNERLFQGYYSGQSQAIDLLGEMWVCEMDLPPSRDEERGADMEGFFDRLLGRVHLIELWNMKRPVPRGTLRGTPELANDVSQLASSIRILCEPGMTIKVGDNIGIGSGQTSRAVTNATADEEGEMVVSIMPRARIAYAAGTAILWDKPTVLFRQAAEGGVPIDWEPGAFHEGPRVKLVEA